MRDVISLACLVINSRVRKLRENDLSSFTTFIRSSFDGFAKLPDMLSNIL